MYAVIRAGGKQYRVAPGDIIKVEKLAPAAEGKVEFQDILAVANDGKIGAPQGKAHVVGQVVEEGRGKKILVFHFKRKKQYKKLQGHRQPFTAVRITEIAFEGQKFTAPELPKKEPKAEKPKAAESAAAAPAETAAPKKKAAAKKTAAKPASKKPAAAKARPKKPKK